MNDRSLAVVTGAAGGIGSAVCRRLIEDGFKVAALDINADGLRELKTALGRSLEIFPSDQTNVAEIRGTIEQVERELGPITALANVLGWSASTRFEAESPQYWDKVVAINYLALLYVVHPVLVGMADRKRGKMVFIASDAGRTGASGQAVYAGAKGAVIAFAKSLARENARYNITVNCVAPGPTQTPLYLKEEKENPVLVERILRTIPLRRTALPAEQAAAISFLLSPDADYITGQTLSVSGGMTMI